MTARSDRPARGRRRVSRGSGGAAVLWTGGKDSVLALHEVRALGLDVSALVTFGPRRGAFRAHPVPVMRAQAAALGIEHRLYRIGPPYRAAYRSVFRSLRREGVGLVVTGDIDRVGGCDSWVRSIAEGAGLDVVTPLWHRSRSSLLRRLRARGFDVVVSYVDTHRLPAGWVGRPLDRSLERDLRAWGRRTGVDAAGEQGEYHTWVLDAPLFRSRLVPEGIATISGPEGAWLRAERLSVRPKVGSAGRQGPTVRRAG